MSVKLSQLKNYLFTHWWILLALLVVLRTVYIIWQNVPSLNQDESALLLNAQLVAQSGRDEWGQAWPVVFKSFGDYKLPGYIYLTSLVGLVIGWSWWMVRIPSFVAGLLLIPATYLLAKNWFGKQAAGWGALLLALSPWSWHYASVGFEANVGLLCLVVSLWLVSKKSSNNYTIVMSLLILLLGMVTYNSPFLLSPLVLLTAWWSFGWQRRDWFKVAAFSLGWVVVVALSLAITLPVTQQKTGIALFSDPQVILDYGVYRQQFTSSWLQTLWGNQYVYWIKMMISNWLSSWNFNFLVLKGGENPWHNIPTRGHVHFLVWLLAPVGLWLATLNTLKKKTTRWLLPILMLIFSLVPAVITVDAPHATRSLFFLVMLSLWAGLAMAQVEAHLKTKQRQWWLALVSVLLLVGFLNWWLPVRQLWRSQVSSRWQVGLAAALEQVPDNNKDVYVLDGNGTLYTYVARAQHLSSQQFLTQVTRSAPDTAGLYRVEQLGRYHFVYEQPVGKEGYYIFPQHKTKWSMIEL